MYIALFPRRTPKPLHSTDLRNSRNRLFIRCCFPLQRLLFFLDDIIYLQSHLLVCLVFSSSIFILYITDLTFELKTHTLPEFELNRKKQKKKQIEFILVLSFFSRFISQTFGQQRHKPTGSPGVYGFAVSSTIASWCQSTEFRSPRGPISRYYPRSFVSCAVHFPRSSLCLPFFFWRVSNTRQTEFSLGTIYRNLSYNRIKAITAGAFRNLTFLTVL
jgi:hypothetical protein